ncbi:TnsA endonuclease N-terminal domain-containing protein [Paenibacillus oryzisoli]|uniref:Integrase catalytic domain-containing protein n=1 Tax=Paenibacillus oryzisoli TaxID=1850517 RepID=A0A197ZXP0_9BACL|nr:TnsA endonuclease N-terminal domain-containing protein [Paenibacillus oryzisoli]OAS13750.1 hypothetical protein A8708_25250 [Paenibacillus oryzisoli]
MLSKQHFDGWCIENQITEQTKKVIEQIRTSPPVRRVQSGSNNVSGKYPSKKMGQSIQFESHTVELPFIYQLEFDSDVLEFYCQPSQIRIDYIGISDGKQKRKTFNYTPDYFVIRKDRAGWVECKSEKDLIKLFNKDPNRYYLDGHGIWRCPPGEVYAKQHNLEFSVFCSSEINWVLLRNTKFLEHYYNNEFEIDVFFKEKILSIVTKEPGILLQDLLNNAKEIQIKSDYIYKLISTGEIYVDLNLYNLSETQYTHVFANIEKARAYVHLESTSKDWSSNNIVGLELIIGKSVSWDGTLWEIINLGESAVSLLSNANIINLTYEQINSLVKVGKISGIDFSSQKHPYVLEAFKKANNIQSRIARERYEIIEPILKSNKSVNESAQSVSARTIRLWMQNFLRAEKIYGNGFIGLFPKDHEKGNRTKKLNPETEKLVETWISNNYETFKQKKILHVYGDFLLECKNQTIQECSYKTFVERIHARPRYEKVKKRQGEKAAYPFESFYLEYQLTSTRHGERPFEIAHIDHTLLDIELIDSSNRKNLGKPWLTFMTDGCTRRILALYVTFDPPSYRSCMMVLRECVKKWSRLPECIVVDGGKEFSSVYFETVLSAFKSIKKQRPASKPRFGSVLERLFGTTNTRFVNNLLGNTQITKNVRQITQKNNPKNLAIWTYEMFVDRLSQYAYQIYDQIKHPALDGNSPLDAFTIAMQNTGERNFTMIPYDETFYILTLPTSNKGESKVEPGKGFKINYLYYWNDEFRHPEIENTKIPVRYDPYNIGIGYAYVNKRWIKCRSNFLFDGKTEKQIKIASVEIKKKFQNHTHNFKLDQTKLSEFLRKCESDEVILQEAKDREVQNASKVNRGKKTNNTTSYSNSIEQQVPIAEIDHDDEIPTDSGVRYGEFF